MAKKIDIPGRDTYYFSDTLFNLLMQKRIRKVLVICSSYDFFMLEEDGRIDEIIFNEYVSLNLRYPPVFIHAGSAKKAFEILKKDDIDLVIEMLSIGDVDTFELAKQIKSEFADIPIVVLTHFSREVSLRLEKEDMTAIDYVFSWLGNADIFMAIIKLIEDKMNAPFDIENVGVQAILLVEDSVRFISSFLPSLYKIILHQSLESTVEALNEHQKMLRRRGRPKILLANNYKEALDYYQKYKNNILGIISDVSYKIKPNKRDTKEKAGLKFCRLVKEEYPNIPFLLQSSDASNSKYAKNLGAGFLNKYSKKLLNDLKEYIITNFGFSDFVFRNPKTGESIYTASDLKSLQHYIEKVPDDVLIYHSSRDDFSKWLNARALFPIAQIFKPLKPEDFKNLKEIRKYIYRTISNYRAGKAIGIIAEFDKNRYDEYLDFARIGSGSIGGKARGLAFMNTVLKKEKIASSYKNITINIPRTIVLSTEVFEEFMDSNSLYDVAMSGIEEQMIINEFIQASLPKKITEDLKTIVLNLEKPLAIRSSSKLEDSFFQPFAGVYNTYMIPIGKDKKVSLSLLEKAIKCVYASVYFKSSKAYMAATSNILDEEKMGIILQEVCGNQYDNFYFPTLSGVARSINYYPIEPEKTTDGTVNVAFGLGKLIADGGITLRFSPKYPKRIIQLSSPELTLKNTQKYFYALNTNSSSFVPSPSDKVNLKYLKIKEAENYNAIRFVASIYDAENNALKDTIDLPGKKVITFSNILNYESFPLAEIVDQFLEIGQRVMNNPVEIEFAANLDTPSGENKIFSFLQIRPIVDHQKEISIKIHHVKKQDTILYSEKSLGNGYFKNIKHIMYIKPGSYNPLNNKKIAVEIDKFNSELSKEKNNYVLIGPGRWGSSDPWLGIPVKWAQISAARIIVEANFKDFQVDPSQGTHFFHNLASFGVGYMTVNPKFNEGFININYLDQFKAKRENDFLKLIEFDKFLQIEIDGRSNKGVIYM